MFGKLSLSAVPYHEPIIMITLACVALLGLFACCWATSSSAAIAQQWDSRASPWRLR